MIKLSRRQEILLDFFLLFVFAVALIRPFLKAKYLDKWASIESTFIGDARFLIAHWPHPQWQPLWYGGTRFDYVYPPGLRYGTAIISMVTGYWPVKAYHFYTGIFYCIGIAGVYLLVRVASGSRGMAWLCGLAERNRFEADAAMTLESVAAPGVTDAYGFAIVAEGPFIIDWRMMVEGLVHDLLGGAGAAHVAAKFHNTVARFLLAAAQRAREITGETAVGLTGGCFANRYLTALLTKCLREEGFEVLRHHEVPCNDGGLSLGQAVVAAARTGVFHPRVALASKKETA
jgi:hypothetical protein